MCRTGKIIKNSNKKIKEEKNTDGINRGYYVLSKAIVDVNKKLGDRAENIVIEEHCIGGAYNLYSYVSSWIEYNKDNVIEEGGAIRDTIDIDTMKSGIMCISVEDENEDELKQWVKERINALYDELPQKKKLKEKELFSWSIGKFYHFTGHRYGKFMFVPDSLSIELLNIPYDLIIAFAYDLLKAFKKKKVVLKMYGERIIRIISYEDNPPLPPELMKDLEKQVAKYLDKGEK